MVPPSLVPSPAKGSPVLMNSLLLREAGVKNREKYQRSASSPMTVLEAVKFKNNTVSFFSIFYMDSMLISFNAFSLSSKTINMY